MKHYISGTLLDPILGTKIRLKPIQLDPIVKATLTTRPVGSEQLCITGPADRAFHSFTWGWGQILYLKHSIFIVSNKKVMDKVQDINYSTKFVCPCAHITVVSPSENANGLLRCNPWSECSLKPNHHQNKGWQHLEEQVAMTTKYSMPPSWLSQLCTTWDDPQPYPCYTSEQNAPMHAKSST